MVNVSVIVPVYNVEEYLDKCLSSLVNQSMKNEMEIIVINLLKHQLNVKFKLYLIR